MARPSLLGSVHALEIVARRNVTSRLTGNYVTSVRGQGLEFDEARPYVPGDPVRHMDWNMTARMDEPILRTYLEERAREIVIALDVSPSMYVGWQERTKLETAIEVAATLGVSAVDAGDRLGFLTFDARVVEQRPPEGGRAQLYRMLETFEQHRRRPPMHTWVSDPRTAIHAVQAMRGDRFVVFLISDFIDHDVPEDLKYVRHRHDVTLVHVYDPLEYAGPSPLRFLAAPTEGLRMASPQRIAPEDAGSLAAAQAVLGEAARKRGLFVHSIASNARIGASLARLFVGKRAWAR